MINILKRLENSIENDEVNVSFYVDRLVEFLKLYPVDLMVGMMKDIKSK